MRKFVGMKITFCSVGRTHEEYVAEGIRIFTKRISNYYTVEWKVIAPPKNSGSLSPEDLKKAEGQIILNTLQQGDVLIVLDENGKQFSSEELAKLIQTKADAATKNLVFLIGGAYGLGKEVMGKAAIKWSLSDLVFPHQLVRLILAEQVYRACTIQRNEKYHHG